MTTRSVIAFLTGQSDPASNALSEDQRAFLDRLSFLPDEKFARNFPYRSVPRPFRKIPLLTASLNNSLQYLRSRQPRFAATHRDEIIRTFSPYDRVIFLAGSCGLELFSNLHLPADFTAKAHVFAYGPVSRNLPRCATLWRVQGSGDRIS
ncbi:MAG: hypothetical protein JWO82_2094, partial [Akkermansiaceae bacterium]|nr:hypothetical protein [Akkermansiaceae bacterium]